MSSHQLHRMFGVTNKTAWFMAHRIRESMTPGDNLPPVGGEGKTVEADETYVGGLEKNKHAKDRNHLGRDGVGKQVVFSLVERGGKVHSHHVQHVTAETLRPILNQQLHASTRFMTDEARQYIPLGKAFMEHHTVDHSIGEYVSGDAHTNTIEGHFSIFKRGMRASISIAAPITSIATLRSLISATKSASKVQLVRPVLPARRPVGRRSLPPRIPRGDRCHGQPPAAPPALPPAEALEPTVRCG